MARKASSKPANSTANLGFEVKLWLAADKLHNNMDAAEPSGARQTGRQASPKGERGGVHQFYTPSWVVRLLVEMLAPYKVRAAIPPNMVKNDLWQKTPSRPLSGTYLNAA